MVPMIDNRPVARGELVGDALSVISLKDLSEDSDPDRVVKRNSYRDLHRPNISHLDWVVQSSSKEEVAAYPPLHSTPLTGRAIKPQRQGHIGGPIAQP